MFQLEHSTNSQPMFRSGPPCQKKSTLRKLRVLQTIHLNFRSFTNLQASSLAHAFSPQESSEPAPSLEAPPVSPPEEEACASVAAPPAQALPGAEQVRSGPARAAQVPADCSAAPRANVQAARRGGGGDARSVV